MFSRYHINSINFTMVLYIRTFIDNIGTHDTFRIVHHACKRITCHSYGPMYTDPKTRLIS